MPDYFLDRGDMRVSLKETNGRYEEKVLIKVNNEWIPVLGSLSGKNTFHLNFKDQEFSMDFEFLKSKKKKIYFTLKDANFDLKLDFCMEDDNILHIRYQIFTNRDVEFSKLGIKYRLFMEKDPDFTWVPHLCPGEDLVIADHIFRSPVMIYKKKNLSLLFIPDIKTLGRNRPFPAIMNMNLKSYPTTISYGFANYKPYRHVLFKHKKKKTLKAVKGTNLTFRYYIIILEGKTNTEVIQFVNRFLWEKYGRRKYYESLDPQILPYQYNAKEGIKAIFDRHALWGNIEINNVNCGGFWVGSWLGNEKYPVKYFNKSNINEFKNNFNKKNKSAAIYNNAWFLNIRTAYGLRYFGDKWQDDDLIEKSRLMLNLITQIPRNQGLFPSIILPSSNNSSEYLTVNGTKAWWPIDDFHIVDASLTMYWLIRISRDFDLLNEDIQNICEKLANLLNKIQLDNGVIPTFINIDKRGVPIVIEDLIKSASSGASLMFLTEFYKISRNAMVLETCERIADFIEENIIPNDKWHDFEAFYSCTYPQKVEYDDYTHSHIMNNLCIYWAAEGFLGLYKVTNKKKYLEKGERILGILSLFQQVWNMPYISYDTFGGFGAQNVDAELNDARQGLFVKTYMEYYLESGKWEYMERGIAALRASWALQLLPEYREICPGNFDGITTDNGIDKGCISENYGHSGKDERIPGFITFDWGVGTALMATAYTKKHFGDIFIDLKENFVFGIDGILIQKFDFEKNKVSIKFEIIEKKESILIKARGIIHPKIQLSLNNEEELIVDSQELSEGFQYPL